jgi:hypothetical protein
MRLYQIQPPSNNATVSNPAGSTEDRTPLLLFTARLGRSISQVIDQGCTLALTLRKVPNIIRTEPYKSVVHFYIPFLRFSLILSSILCLSPKWSLPLNVSNYASIYTIPASCPAHLTYLYVVSSVILGENRKPWLRNFLYCFLASSLLCPIFFLVLSSQTPSVCILTVQTKLMAGYL